MFRDVFIHFRPIPFVISIISRHFCSLELLQQSCKWIKESYQRPMFVPKSLFGEKTVKVRRDVCVQLDRYGWVGREGEVKEHFNDCRIRNTSDVCLTPFVNLN